MKLRNTIPIIILGFILIITKPDEEEFKMFSSAYVHKNIKSFKNNSNSSVDTLILNTLIDELMYCKDYLLFSDCGFDDWSAKMVGLQLQNVQVLRDIRVFGIYGRFIGTMGNKKLKVFKIEEYIKIQSQINKPN
jgi:hypothetical protein